MFTMFCHCSLMSAPVTIIQKIMVAIEKSTLKGLFYLVEQKMRPT